MIDLFIVKDTKSITVATNNSEVSSIQSVNDRGIIIIDFIHNVPYCFIFRRNRHTETCKIYIIRDERLP